MVLHEWIKYWPHVLQALLMRSTTSALIAGGGNLRTFRGAEVGSDHNLVVARICLRLKKTGCDVRALICN